MVQRPLFHIQDKYDITRYMILTGWGYDQTMIKKKTRTGVIAAALCLICFSMTAAAGNNPDVESRGSGYYSIEIQDDPELSVIYEDAGEPDVISGFAQKKRRLETEESEYIQKDTDTIFVSCREFDTGSHRVFLTHVLVADPQTQVKAGLSHDDFGGEREKTSDFAKRTGAALAVNGSYFYYNTGQPINMCAPVVINDGQILRGGDSNGSEICFRFDGSFFSPHPGMLFSDEILIGLGVMFNFGTADPLLISDGVPMSFPNDTRDGVYPRTAVGEVCPGEYYLLTAGYDGSYSGGLSYRQMQSIFYHLGCVYARSLDGGGSATLVINGELKNVPAEGSEREVVDFLAFYE